MRDIRLTLNISSHLLNARQAEKINRFKKSSSKSVKGISSTYLCFKILKTKISIWGV